MHGFWRMLYACCVMVLLDHEGVVHILMLVILKRVVIV